MGSTWGDAANRLTERFVPSAVIREGWLAHREYRQDEHLDLLGWPTWWEPETTYAFSDGRDLEDGEDFPTILFQRRNGSLNIISNGTRGSHSLRISGQREEDVYSTLNCGWQNCHGLSMEDAPRHRRRWRYPVAH